MFKHLKLTFASYPATDKSPEASHQKYDEKYRQLQVRGNVYSRLKGELSQEKRAELIEAASRVSQLKKYLPK